MKRLSDRRIAALLAGDGKAIEGLDFTAYEFELALHELRERRKAEAARRPAKAKPAAGRAKGGVR